MKRCAAFLALAACSAPEIPIEDRGPMIVHLADMVDERGEGEVTLELAEPTTIQIHLDGEPRIVELTMPEDVWHAPQPYDQEVLEFAADAGTTTIWARGAPVPASRRERSLVWTDPAVVDDPSIVGLGRVLAAASSDGHGGMLLDRWFRRFATTLHSERAGPAQLATELVSQYGEPATWDLDALPFKVTAVHNRLDLAARGGGCGELRVSFASTHPLYAPFHLLFLFRQEPESDDKSADDIHCLGAARRWARLSALDGDDFVSAARAWLDEALVHERFLLAETVELTVSPWEWRQWIPVDDDVLDNPGLFQTVATPLLNQPGALRDDFLAFVDENAAGLMAREVEIPPKFRSASARVPPSAPAERLSLDDPELAFRIEIVGCPTCHTHDANFVHTAPDRSFSPFYDRELDARAERLDAMGRGMQLPTPPFGPLQSL